MAFIHVPRIVLPGDEQDAPDPLLNLQPCEAERALALPDGRIAVGRDFGETTFWRIIPEALTQRIPHPAWLWTDEDAFGGAPDIVLPPVQPLRVMLRRALAVCGSPEGTARMLAAAVSVLRKRRPVMLLADWRVTADPYPARSLLLALITLLPPKMRTRLSLSTWEVDPRQGQFDVVISDRRALGYVGIHADAPPTSDDDVVAAYLLDRLLDDDPEAAEAAAFFTARHIDPWGEGIRVHLRDAMPHGHVDALDIAADRERAVGRVIHKLRAGIDLNPAMLSEIALVTQHTGDARAWRILQTRSPEERLDALDATLDGIPADAATEPLLRAIAASGPFRRTLRSFVGLLLRTLADGRDPELALTLLEEALEAEPDELSLASRAALWSAAVSTLIARNETNLALHALLSRPARAVAADGSPIVLVHGFLALPRRDRTDGLLRTLLEVIGHSPGADRAMAELWRGMRAESHEVGASSVVSKLLLHHWARLRSGAVDPTAGVSDALLDAIRGTPFARDWVDVVARTAPFDRLRALIAPVVDARSGRLWSDAELTRSTSRGLSARERLASMTAFFPEAIVDLEPVARELLGECIVEVALPDDMLASLAWEFAAVPGSSKMWPLVAVAAAPQGLLTEASIEEAVRTGLKGPLSDLDRDVLLRTYTRWASRPKSPTEESAFTTRLMESGAFGDREYTVQLVIRLLRNVAALPDGSHRLTVMTREILARADTDAVHRMFVDSVIGEVWDDEVPDAYLDAIQMATLDERAREDWRKALQL